MKEWLIEIYGFSQSVTLPLFGYKQDGKEISLNTEAFHFNGIRTPGAHHYITFNLQSWPISKNTLMVVPIFLRVSQVEAQAIFVLTHVVAHWTNLEKWGTTEARLEGIAGIIGLVLSGLLINREVLLLLVRIFTSFQFCLQRLFLDFAPN